MGSQVVSRKVSIPKSVGAVIGIVLFLSLWFMPPMWGLSARGMQILGLILMCIVFWVTQPIPAEFTATLVFFVPWITGVTDADVAFSGFTSSTTWFIFGGLIIGKIITITGLDKRITLVIMNKLGRFGKSFTGILATIGILTFFGSLIIPSGTVLTTLLCAQIFPLISVFEEEDRDQVGRALMMLIPMLVIINGRQALSGSGSNTVLLGVLQEVGSDVSWIGWFLGNAPACLLLTVGLIWYFKKVTKVSAGSSDHVAQAIDSQLSELKPMSVDEKKSAALFIVALALWVTGVWTGIPVAMVALGVALVSMFPVVGVQDFRTTLSRMNWPIFLYVAAVMSLPHIMNDAGVDQLFNTLFSSFGGGISSALAFLAVLWLLSQLAGWLGLGIAAPMLILPFCFPIAAQLGISPVVVVLAHNLMQPCVLFYHAPAPLIAASYGTFGQLDFAKRELLVMVTYIPIILLLFYLWWPLLASWGLI